MILGGLSELVNKHKFLLAALCIPQKTQLANSALRLHAQSPPTVYSHSQLPHDAGTDFLRVCLIGELVHGSANPGLRKDATQIVVKRVAGVRRWDGMVGWEAALRRLWRPDGGQGHPKHGIL